MKFLKQAALAAIAVLLVACGGGGGGGTTTPSPVLAVTVTGAGTVASDGTYTVPSGATIMVTCNVSCVLVPSATNATYSNVTNTASSWGAVAVGSNVTGKITVVASGTGLTPLTTVINILPKLTVTVTGAGSANANNGSYTATHNSVVTVSCSHACTLATFTTLGSSISNSSQSSTSLTTTLLSPTAAGTVTIRANANGQTINTEFNVTTPPQTALTAAQLTTLTKSANTANFSIDAVAGVARYLFSMVSTGARPTASTGTNQQLPATSSTGGTISSPCVTGSYTASWSIANNSSVRINDFIEITYINCVNASGAKLNGTAGITLADFGSSGYSGDVSLSNFVKTTSAGTIITVLSSNLKYGFTTTTSVVGGTYTTKTAYDLTGDLKTTVSATASNLQTGLKTYTSTNIINSVTYPSATSTTVKYSSTFDSTDGTYTYAVTNNTPSVYTTGGAFVSNGNTSITYGTAKLDVDYSNLSATVTGVNTNGAAIPAIILGAYYF